MARLIAAAALAFAAHATRAQLPKVELWAGGLSDLFSHGRISVDGGPAMDAELRWRGASAKRYSKKSYAVKLLAEDGGKLDTTLLGMREDNSWILDAMAVDKARMRNRVSTDLWLDMSRKSHIADLKPGMVNGTRGKFVEVWLNGVYEGIYCLTEKIDRKQLKLRKAEKGSVRGVLYKIVNHGFMNHKDVEHYGYSPGAGTWDAWELQYPGSEDSREDAWWPLAETEHWLNHSDEEALADSFALKFDLPVWVDYTVFVDMIFGEDNESKNFYTYLYDITGDDRRLGIAPWDMDHSWGRRYDGAEQPPEGMLHWEWHGAFKHIVGDTGVAPGQCSARYAELRAGLFTTEKLKSRFARYFDLFRKSGAAKRETSRWSGKDGIELDFDAEQRLIEEWIDRRIAFLDSAYGYSAREGHKTGPCAVYDLCGRMVGKGGTKNLPPGIYVSEGRKILVR